MVANSMARLPSPASSIACTKRTCARRGPSMMLTSLWSLCRGAACVTLHWGAPVGKLLPHLQHFIIVAGCESSLPLLTVDQPSQDILLVILLYSGELSLQAEVPCAPASLAEVLSGNTFLHKLHLPHHTALQLKPCDSSVYSTHHLDASVPEQSASLQMAASWPTPGQQQPCAGEKRVAPGSCVRGTWPTPLPSETGPCLSTVP